MDPFEYRKYQEDLIDLAKRTNIIACLPTGAGKTYIALKLTNHFLNHVKEKNKKIVFVACTIPLLNQQCGVFKKYTPYKCNAFSGSGSEKFDLKTPERFRFRFEECEVLLMTPQYFVNLLTIDYVALNEIALIIFDECHHATSANPMNQIMGKYREIKETVPDYELPRILGLSATVIRKNVSSSELGRELSLMEKRLDCIAVTYDLPDEVSIYSTNARVKQVAYCNLEIQLPEFDEGEFLLPIRNAIEWIQKLPFKLKFDDQHQRVHPLSPTNMLFHGKGFTNALENCLDEMSILLSDFGPYGMVHVAIMKIEQIKGMLRSCNEEFKINVHRVALNALRLFLVRARIIIPAAFKKVPIEHLLSDKILKTLELLKPYKDKMGTDEALCGLIFCKRKTTAIALKEIFLHLKLVNPKGYGFISPGLVLGSNTAKNLPNAYRVSAKAQAEVVKGFREKKFNLLLCTSVLEEGIDVPSCNLVVRFDSVDTFTSFMQSMGRARKKDAQYCILMNSLSLDSECSRIHRFKCVNDSLSETLQAHLKTIKNGKEQIPETDEVDELGFGIPDFCPNGKMAAKVTAFSCISLVSRYAGKVCSSDSTIKCWDWYDRYEEKNDDSGNKVYRASITLPEGSSVVERIIQGFYMKNKYLAKKSAFMEACKQIYENGGFDKNFNPVTNSSKLTDYLLR